MAPKVGHLDLPGCTLEDPVGKVGGHQNGGVVMGLKDRLEKTRDLGTVQEGYWVNLTCKLCIQVQKKGKARVLPHKQEEEEREGGKEPGGR